MRRADINQILLVLSGILVAVLLGLFLYREIFPEYKIYQNDYVALEEFRSSYMHEAIAPFKFGVKQIVLEREDKGPPTIDRCISCHVALQVPYFSPTKIAHDINGNIMRNEEGKPIQVFNEEYIWDKLDQKIAELRDEKVNQQLSQQGESKQVQQRLNQANSYEALKTAQVDAHVYDVKKVLSMHPLIGKETRPFEFHPIEEYGCASCHNGNGRGLTTDKAHGPVFDEQYETEHRGAVPTFIESDPDNDPRFAHVFNAKPGPNLLFQTEPIFVGPLIQAKCMFCHQTSQMQLQTALYSASELTDKRQKQFELLQKSFEKDKETLITLLILRKKLLEEGYQQAIDSLNEQISDYQLPIEEIDQASSQKKYLEKLVSQEKDPERAKRRALEGLNQQLTILLGSIHLVDALQKEYNQKGINGINPFLKANQQDVEAKGSLFVKSEIINYEQETIRHVQDTEQSLQTVTQDQKVMSALISDVDELTRNFQRGKELYLSQACYACHRIAGFARGGVGPELTRIGESYPWYIKESIVWPQADLKTSTMPNMRLDHLEVQDLMAFLLAQRGSNKAVSQRTYLAALQGWEAGTKMSWEKPISPAQIYDLSYAMTVFATEGCASCHRLLGFDSNTGFKIEKEKHTFDQLYEEQQWFKKLFPEVISIGEYNEELPSSAIVDQIEKYAQEIDEKIVYQVRDNAILEEIEQKHPQAIEALYSNFRYADRAKDHYYITLAQQTKDPEKLAQIHNEHAAWKDRVHRVLMMYIQTYGLGRLIGPHLNWSGIFRTDEWLMEHFHNPTGHVPRSLMPVFPFDNTKFYALTHMLDKLGIRNRNAIREIWAKRGFNPQEAFQIHCVQCHGISLAGNGIISEWIYPIPKNLNNADFLRNLTKERAVYSILHGVMGTPMPPWGEVAQDKPEEIRKQSQGQPVLTEQETRYLVDWLFSNVPGSEILKESNDIPKWNYRPEDVLDELQKEGGELQSLPNSEVEKLKQREVLPEKELPQENVLPPAQESVVSFLSLFPSAEGYYAAIRPEIYPRTLPKGVQEQKTVEEVFDILPATGEQPDTYRYYIKKKYYTPYNIQEGQKFFLLNCAVCHGNEADGGGARSQAMQDAKPRMLNNLDWIRSRDDLRLLRSIKYGVSGTSMTPWGDFTNSLQRIQLVIFIRSLTKEKDRRAILDSLLYKGFDIPLLLIDQARADKASLLDKEQQNNKRLKERQNQLEDGVKAGKVESKAVLDNYQKVLESDQKIEYLKEYDHQFLELAEEVKKEKEMYANLGVTLISKDLSDDLFQTYFEILKLNEQRYSWENKRLVIRDAPKTDQHVQELQQEMVKEIEREMTRLEQEKRGVQGRIASAKKTESLSTLQADLNAYQQIKIRIITDIGATLRSIRKQKEMLEILYPNQGRKPENKAENQDDNKA